MAATTNCQSTSRFSPSSYWLTRFVLLRWLGLVYAVAFLAAAFQLVPLVGEHGLLPARLFMARVGESSGSSWAGFCELPSLFWLDHSDTALRVIPWLGFILSLVLLSGFANVPILFLLWFFYMSIVHVGQDWYSYGWEIQLLETGFLAIFLCPLLDARPFPKRPPPLPIIWLFRWLIFRIMIGSGLIKLRGDSCWRDLTALYYHFETQPIPNALSRWFHFLPHPILKFGTAFSLFVEVVAPWFLFWPRIARHIAGLLVVGLQVILIFSGNLSFLNWLTILPALACFDDTFWKRLLPAFIVRRAEVAAAQAEPSRAMTLSAWAATALLVFLSIQPVANLFSPGQIMNTSFDRLHLVNTYGAFGSVGRERAAIIFEGTNDSKPDDSATWREYPFAALPDDPSKPPHQIAPYQPHLDWQLWFAAMATPREYPWTLNLVWKLLHNDPATLSLFGGNPFPNQPPRHIRAVLYIYRFARPGNPDHVYWTRERLGLWLPPLSADDPRLQQFLERVGWL